MLIGGLWHGANWRFVLWGGMHGLFLAIEKIFNIPEKIDKNKVVRIFAVIFTFHLFLFTMIFFRAQSYQASFDMLSQILFYFQPEVFWQWVTGYPVIVILMIIGFVTHYTPKSFDDKIRDILTIMPMWAQAMILAVVILIVMQFKSADIQPFIYFQF
jgi:D-alanyl-lipoteichoic acid acyltransferase DltB (MBOAT superfamily)